MEDKFVTNYRQFKCVGFTLGKLLCHPSFYAVHGFNIAPFHKKTESKWINSSVLSALPVWHWRRYSGEDIKNRFWSCVSVHRQESLPLFSSDEWKLSLHRRPTEKLYHRRKHLKYAWEQEQWRETGHMSEMVTITFETPHVLRKTFDSFYANSTFFFKGGIRVQNLNIQDYKNVFINEDVWMREIPDINFLEEVCLCLISSVTEFLEYYFLKPESGYESNTSAAWSIVFIWKEIRSMAYFSTSNWTLQLISTDSCF